jgi:hypothetical protein
MLRCVLHQTSKQRLNGLCTLIPNCTGALLLGLNHCQHGSSPITSQVYHGCNLSRMGAITDADVSAHHNVIVSPKAIAIPRPGRLLTTEDTTADLEKKKLRSPFRLLRLQLERTGTMWLVHQQLTRTRLSASSMARYTLTDLGVG